MALSEKRIVKQVSIVPEIQCVNVQWADQIFRDGELVAETYHRKAYSLEQRDQFLAEVDGADRYTSALGWQ